MLTETKKRSEQILVTLFVVPDCPLCAEARLWLKQQSIEYLERDVSQNFGALRAMYGLTRQRFVPVFEADGRAIVRPGNKQLMEFFSNR